MVRRLTPSCISVERWVLPCKVAVVKPARPVDGCTERLWLVSAGRLRGCPIARVCLLGMADGNASTSMEYSFVHLRMVAISSLFARCSLTFFRSVCFAVQISTMIGC